LLITFRAFDAIGLLGRDLKTFQEFATLTVELGSQDVVSVKTAMLVETIRRANL
jgi:hypothetical protein